MHLGILSQYYPPEIGAPQARLSELASYFVQRGHGVTVLTAKPNYPIGRVFDGYEDVVCEERQQGVRILRAPILPSQSTAMLPRLANYFSFVLSSVVVGAGKLDPPDFLLVESPPLFLGFSGVFLAAVKAARMIFNVSDLWPESAVRLGVVREDSRWFRMAAALEARCYSAAWLVTGQSRTIVDSVKNRFPKTATYHLSNGCDTTEFRRARATDRARRLLDPEGGNRVFLYAGLHGIAQGLRQIVEVADRVRSNPALKFVLIGDGPEKKQLVEEAERRGLPNLRFLPPMAAAEIPAILASADGILVTLKMEIPGAVPSKLYEAMASERPVILVASGEASQIARENGCLTVDPGDIDALERAVLEAAGDSPATRDRCHQARLAAEEKFDRARIANRFIDFLEARVAPGRNAG